VPEHPGFLNISRQSVDAYDTLGKTATGQIVFGEHLGGGYWDVRIPFRIHPVQQPSAKSEQRHPRAAFLSHTVLCLLALKTSTSQQPQRLLNEGFVAVELCSGFDKSRAHTSH
jgi:hypothetical protein